MDYETKLVHARLDAIESVLLNLLGSDQRKLDQVRTMLSDAYRSTRDKANRPTEVKLQQSIPYNMPAGRDEDAEAAKVEAYENLCRKFGAPL
ncbi:hypothetical protein [Paraburkholderia sp. D1E]|uniref:hypothetical protein n=1 Tax=Paraburkholderia sp. D1E TaxID=3461398 RepID=UPI004045A0BE